MDIGHSDGQLGFVCRKYAQEPLILAVNYPALGEDLVDDGYQDVVNIDISSVLIETMQAKYAHKSVLKYIKMDVRDMSPFESGSFDAVIDKGTLDTFMCGEDDITAATQLLKEVERVLKDKGAYILITFDSPNNRLDLLRSVELWNIKLHLLERAAKSSRRKRWELSAPRPLDRDGSWATEALGSHLDVFYTYVCIKDESLSANQATDSEIPNDP
ncbi:EEF1A lysine methyltransferase 4-like [Zingiber officinale]|uniref:EEF1A lysine methyltransferase 4-like n=1 Tax=Zingiber officinale TaxID=94328 RepID=UPI001C4D495E|nr:EEF1A lysine methyltransferase 4-like [Zingiber officinale]